MQVVQIAWTERNLATAAGGVQRIVGLGHAGHMPDEPAHNGLAALNGGAEMAGAPHLVDLEEVVGFDPRSQQPVEQFL